MRSAVAFLTVVGRSRPPGPTTLDWFPVVGAAMGLGLGAFWWVADRAWPAALAAALVVGADLAMTGLLHLDGLVDCADGLLAPMDRARRLAVMASPESGAFGVGAAGSFLILRWAALWSVRPSALLLAGLWCLSRTLMAAVARIGRYARSEGGLVDAFAGPTHWASILIGLAGSAALAGAWKLVPGLAAIGAAAAGGLLVWALAHRRIGGYTGDVLGAGVFVAETVGLVVAAARW